jgi:tripartite-type tricarboxylate transporter receptor subunit TctC
MKGLSVAIALAIVAGTASAAAQSYPSRPITMINPFPPGGATDILARTLVDHMKGSLGQSIIVENVPGAGGSVGTGRAARAAPDGYTLSFGNWASHVGSGATYALQYDLLKDLEPVAYIATSPTWMVARKNFPAADMKEMIAWLKANPDNTGMSFQFVPYRGGAPASQDLVAGNVDLMCDLAANSLPFVRTGQIKAYAVMAKARWFAAPDVPTIEEMGVPGLYMSFWHGVWASKGTPKEIVAKLNAAVVNALADPGVRQRFTDQGHEIPPSDQQTPEALAAHHKAETEKWWPIIKDANIRLQ